jgi:hypothetical protein
MARPRLDPSGNPRQVASEILASQTQRTYIPSNDGHPVARTADMSRVESTFGGDLASASARRPLTLRDGHGLDLMAASGQIPVAAHATRNGGSLSSKPATTVGAFRCRRPIRRCWRRYLARSRAWTTALQPRSGSGKAFFGRASTAGMKPVEITTDRPAIYSQELDKRLPATRHTVQQDADNPG